MVLIFPGKYIHTMEYSVTVSKKREFYWKQKKIKIKNKKSEGGK